MEFIDDLFAPTPDLNARFYNQLGPSGQELLLDDFDHAIWWRFRR
jgi:hypothetical protein